MRALLTIAAGRGGLFTARQARAAGVSHRMLSYYARQGDLERLSYGIYKVDAAPPHPFEDVIAACLWVGETAAASHDTALALYDLTDTMPPTIHVSTPAAFRGRRRGVVVHQVPLPPKDRVVHHETPVTSLPRTLADVAGRSPALAQQALREALLRGDVSLRGLARYAEQSPSLLEVLDKYRAESS